MFNRIFKTKDASASKSLPPGHRPSQPGGAGGDNGGAAPPAEPMGGGFFNLPPTLGKGPQSYASPGQSMGAPPPGPAPAQGGFTRPSSAGPHHGVPSYGAPQPPQYSQPQAPPSSSSYGAPAPASGGMDMFGGMSLKAPPSAAPSGYGGAPSQPPRPSPVKYGGYGGAASHSSYEPQAPAAMPALFSGLDVVPGGATAAVPSGYNPDAEITRPVVKRNVGSGGRSGSFNSVGSSGGAEPVAQRQSIGPGVGGGVGASRVGVNKTVKKKKTKSFRPGFGRQLSDESIAALQRGELNEDEVIQQHTQSDDHDSNAAPRIATNATDLAHLLPPVKSGSLLAGLTTHAPSTTSSSGGSILSGLTVHGSAPSPRSSQSADGGGLLAGLSVHGQSNEQPDASMSVVLPSKKKANAPPPEPAAPPTPEEKLMNTLRDFHASAVNFRNSALKQNEEENRILERKVQLAKQLTQYEIDLRTIEAQQQQAVEVEDFEKADALNSTINSVRHCITLSESDVRKVDGELTAFVKSKEKAFTNQLRSTRGTLKELEKFREDQEMERGALREELKKYEVEQSEHLQFEAERIDTELNHVSSNMDHLTSEKAEIEGTIEELCKTEIAQREDLLVEKAGVQEEIRELERQLRLKMEQMHDIQSSIDKAEKEINVVRSRYSRQLKRIADREEGLLKTKSEVEADAEHLKEKKKQFTESIHDYESRISAFGKRMTAVKKEMRAAMLLASVLEVQETRREQAIVRKKQHTAELTSLADSAAIAEQGFTMLQKQHEDLERSLAIHHNAIASAEAMIPKLEQEKKAAAAQRNFKEAARISKDIKALEKDQATAEEMVEVVEMELQDLQERIDKRETEYEEKKEELKAVEKQLELTTVQELWKEAKHLRKSLRKFGKIKSEGIAASNGVDFRASALLLVQAEYDACIIQAEALEQKYEVADPTADEEEEEEEEEDSEDDSVDEEEVQRLTEVGGYAGGDAEAAASGTPENGDVDLSGADGPAALEELTSKIEELEEMIEKATENEEYELAAKLDDKIETLRRRQQSLVAIGASVVESSAPVTMESSADAAYSREGEKATTDHEYEQHGDEDEEEDEGNTPEELENELRLLRARVKMLEADIERATENEEYETAAELEDEMQQLRDEEAEILELLAESEGHAAHTEPQEMQSPPAQEPTLSLFQGLGFKSADPVDEPPAPVASKATSMFAGLQLGATSPEDGHDEEEHDEEEHSEPVEVVDAVIEPPTSPKQETAATLSPREAPISPRRLSVGSGPNSPRRKSSLSMFSGLQVGATTAEELPRKSSVGSSSGETGAVFEGLQLGSSISFSAVQEESSTSSATSMFEGLSLGSSVETTAVDTTMSSSLFGGLTLTTAEDVAVEEDEENVSDDGVVVEASDATEPTSEPLSVFGGLSIKSAEVEEGEEEEEEEQEESSLDISTTTSVTVAETETEATTSETTTTSTDLFGGLSFASLEPVAAPVADAEETAAQD